MNLQQNNEDLLDGGRRLPLVEDFYTIQGEGFHTGKPAYFIRLAKEIVIHEEKADVVRSIFDDYLAGASLGKIVDLLFKKGVVSPTGKVKWTRAAVDKLLANKKYIPLVGIKIYMDTQFEKARRCNVDYDKAGYPRKAVRYQSPVFDTK